MREAARRWLPGEVADDPISHAILGEAVAAWSVRWFAGQGVSVSRAVVVRSRMGDHDLVMGLEASSVRLKLVGDGRTRLVSLALDMPIERLELTDTDRQLVETVAHDLMEDLLKSVQEALGLPEAKGLTSFQETGLTDGGLDLSLAEGYGPDLAILTVPFSELVHLRLARMPPQRPRADAPDVLSAAISSEKVGLEVRLGGARLSLGDIRTLAVGDVVVLDQIADEPLALMDRKGRRVLGLRPIRLESPTTLSVCP